MNSQSISRLRSLRRALVVALAIVLGCAQSACVEGGRLLRVRTSDPPLTATAAIGLYDSARDASLRMVIDGLDEDQANQSSRALAKYQRAIRVDPTNPFAFLALARHHLDAGKAGEASAFLDQARSLFEAEGRLGPEVDVWGLGLRAGIDRDLGFDDRADALFSRARELSPRIWADERLSPSELR